MKKIKKRLKVIALFLSGLILLQSCVVYHKTPTTLQRASQEQLKTKITNTNGERFKYQYVSYEDGVYYGVNEESGKFIKTPLDEEYITEVLTKNKKASTWLTVGLISAPVLFLIVGLIIIESEGVGVESPW
ncbi:hypothetical protein [Muriicola marianensis]|uniref:DUF3592 domain-containing protein n=1 Tax=Muriicola marianensis TaxID=1324801 RepID=A0ABQ1QUX9_9FLAO|nr:hypothetical protein [Muriicola marianensis]GGD47620.1 hypothetical protein GCM10011361_13000 [Muriicola marianensis]